MSIAVFALMIFITATTNQTRAVNVKNTELNAKIDATQTENDAIKSDINHKSSFKELAKQAKKFDMAIDQKNIRYVK